MRIVRNFQLSSPKSADATAYSSWLSAVPQASAAGRLTGSPNAFQPAFGGDLFAPVAAMLAGRATTKAGRTKVHPYRRQTGQTIFSRSFILITTAMR